MLRQILWTHAKWTRSMVLSVALIAFLLPAAVWNLFGSFDGNAAFARPFIEGFSSAGPFAAFMACLTGFLMAALPWQVDGQAKHVYPLSLPITWPRYVGYRFASGALLLGVPALALLLGCLLALSMVDLPPVVRAYPVAFALRYLVASLLAYGMSFALQYLGGRRAAPILLGLLVGLVALPIVLEVLDLAPLRSWLVRLLVEWPGPFAVFAETWRLVDV